MAHFCERNSDDSFLEDYIQNIVLQTRLDLNKIEAECHRSRKKDKNKNLYIHCSDTEDNFVMVEPTDVNPIKSNQQGKLTLRNTFLHT